MARTSHYKDDFPLRARGYARDGLNNKQIAEQFGVAETTLYKYFLQYPELKDSIAEGRHPVDIEVEDALLKSALGHVQVLKKEEVYQGKVIKYKVEVYIQPYFKAQEFWLCNRKESKYRRTDRQASGSSAGEGATLVEMVKAVAKMTKDALIAAESRDKPGDNGKAGNGERQGNGEHLKKITG